MVFSQSLYSDAGLFVNLIMQSRSVGMTIKNKRLLELSRSESVPVSGSCPTSSGFLSCSFEELFDQAWSDPEYTFDDFSDEVFSDDDGLDFDVKKVIIIIYIFKTDRHIDRHTDMHLQL